jgi:Tfp pilus assembly protein PilE
MYGVGVAELIVIVIIVGLLIAFGVLTAVLLRVVWKKKDSPLSDPQQEKERKKKRILLTCAGCFVGFLVLLAVFSVFASIALPGYLHYRVQSRQSEARTILMGLYEAETAFHRSTNRYSSDPGEIGFTPASEPRYYRWEITYADDRRFEAYAWGNIDEDATLDTWKVTEQAREPVHIVDDLSQ